MIIQLKSVEIFIVAFSVLWFSRFFNLLLEDFSDGRGYSGPGVIFQLVSLSLYAGAIILLYWRSSTVVSLIRTNPLPVLFVILCFLSYIWSVDPAVSLRRSFAALGMMAVGMLAVVVVNERGGSESVYTGLLVGMLVSYAAVILVPSIGIADGRLVGSHAGLWQGIYGFKNALAQIVALLAIFLILRVNSKAIIILLCMALLMLLMTKSTSSIISFISAVSCFGLLSIYKFKSKTLCIFICLMLTLIISLIAINIEYIVYDLIGKDFTASGRVDIWAQVLDAAGETFWGYGYGGVFWGETTVAYDYMDEFYTTLGHSHNGYVDSKLELGVLGLALYVLALVVPLVRYVLIYQERDPVLEAKIMILIFLLVYSLSGSSYIRPNTILFFMFFYSSFHMVRKSG